MFAQLHACAVSGARAWHAACCIDRMHKHWKAFAILEALMLVVFVAAIVDDSFILAVCSVEVGVTALFVMSIAWMRPKGYPPEHHPKIDKALDDTAP